MKSDILALDAGLILPLDKIGQNDRELLQKAHKIISSDNALANYSTLLNLTLRGKYFVFLAGDRDSLITVHTELD